MAHNITMYIVSTVQLNIKTTEAIKWKPKRQYNNKRLAITRFLKKWVFKLLLKEDKVGAFPNTVWKLIP